MVTVPLYFSLSLLDHTKAHSVSRKLCDLLQNVCVYSGTVHAPILSSFGFSVLSHSVPTLSLIFFPFWLFITKTEASSWTLYVSYHFLFGPSFPPSSDIWTLHPASFSYSFQLLFYSTLKVKTKEESEHVPDTTPIFPSSIFVFLPKWTRPDWKETDGDISAVPITLWTQTIWFVLICSTSPVFRSWLYCHTPFSSRCFGLSYVG